MRAAPVVAFCTRPQWPLARDRVPEILYSSETIAHFNDKPIREATHAGITGRRHCASADSGHNARRHLLFFDLHRGRPRRDSRSAAGSPSRGLRSGWTRRSPLGEPVQRGGRLSGRGRWNLRRPDRVDASLQREPRLRRRQIQRRPQPRRRDRPLRRRHRRPARQWRRDVSGPRHLRLGRLRLGPRHRRRHGRRRSGPGRGIPADFRNPGARRQRRRNLRRTLQSSHARKSGGRHHGRLRRRWKRRHRRHAVFEPRRDFPRNRRRQLRDADAHQGRGQPRAHRVGRLQLGRKPRPRARNGQLHRRHSRKR